MLDRYPDDQVTVLDKLTYAGNPATCADLAGNPRFTFVQGDIADAAVVEPLVAGVDAVVNFAAETHVDRSILDAGAFIETDVRGTWVLLEAARALQARALPPGQHRRGVRRTSPTARRRRPTAGAAQPVLGQQGRRRPDGAGLQDDLRPAGR